MTAATLPPLAAAWSSLRRLWDRLAVYLPVILMAVMALGSYWLARNTPGPVAIEAKRDPKHEPDYFMRGFSVKTFEAQGRLKSEVRGTEARHFPDTDTLEIDQPRIHAFNLRGELTVATARLGISNADGSEVQLIGDAVVTRAATKDASGRARPAMEFRGEFLHVFVNTEKVKSHKPVTLVRGNDQFTADALDYDNLDRVADLVGRVRGVLTPSAQ